MTIRTLLLTALAGLALAAPASAATLSNAGGTLTYTGTGGESDVEFERTNPGEVRVTRDIADDDDPITDPAPGCATNTVGSDYTCTGVTRVVADGGGGNDILDALQLTDIPATLTGGDGLDGLTGGDVGDVINGGAGSDDIEAGAGDDTVDGGADQDRADGDEGNDTVTGGLGPDFVIGGDGDDTLNGGDGDDFVVGGDGNDRMAGEGGDDRFAGDLGNDDLTGGAGYDEAIAAGFFTTPPVDTFVTLDDQADDRLSGTAGEADNVHADIESVRGEPRTLGGGFGFSANDTFIGNGLANALSGDAGNDTLDGGAGNDVLTGGDGDDTIRARDGFADFVSCGAGADTVEADTLDTLQECETTNVTDAGNANEDRPPTVTLAATPGLFGTTAPTVLTATAADDRGVTQVQFIDDDRIVCADTTAPYTCDYAPRGDDVGRNTLVAIAIDTSQQTASATRTFRVDRFTPTITGRVTPGRDTRAPFRFRTTGRLRLPAAVTPAAGCADGIVSVQVKAGGKTISTRRAGLTRTCSFATSVTFGSRRRFTRAGTLRFTIRFTGNEVLKRSAAVARNIRTRR